MAANVDDILPKASDVMMRIAEAQAEKAAAHDRQKAPEQAEKDSMINSWGGLVSGMNGSSSSSSGHSPKSARCQHTA